MANSFEKYEIKGYEVSDDVEVMYTSWEMTPEMLEAIEEAEDASISAEPSDYKLISGMIEKYPHVPFFKDLLCDYYLYAGDLNKSAEANDDLLSDHPDFLQGYINRAIEYLENDEFEKVSKILTANFDLKDLFPTRDVFYIEEFLKMQHTAILYFMAIDEDEKAWDRYRVMEEVGPSEDYTSFAREHLMNENFDEDYFDVYDEEDDDDMEDEMMEGYIGTDVLEQPMTIKTEMPEYNHELVKELYFHFFDEFPDGLITEISELPRESLIEDLETMINDSFERFNYLTEEDGLTDSSFVAHAIFMLAEINAIEKAPLIYKVLSQSYEYLDWFLEEVFEYDLFDPFYKLLAGEPERMFEFIKKPGVGNMPRIVVLSLIKELALQDKTKKFIAINYHDQLLDFFIAAKPEDNVFDNMVLDAVVAHLVLLGADHALPKIKYVLDEGMLLNFADMPFETMKGIMQNPRPTEKLQFLSMEETYEQIDFNESDEYDDDFDFDSFPDDFKLPEGVSQKEFEETVEKVRKSMVERGELDAQSNGAGMTVVESPKPGRNEPCFCGSGKKYKKCCLGKDE